MIEYDRARLDILAEDALLAVMTSDGRVDREEQRAALTKLIDSDLKGRSVEFTRELAAEQLAAQAVTRQRRRQSYRVDHESQLILWDSEAMFKLGNNLDVRVEDATRDDLELVKKVKGEVFNSFREKWLIESQLLSAIQGRYTSPSQTWRDIDLDGLAVYAVDGLVDEAWDSDDPRWA